ncbi:MAG: hypothetical protein A2Y13_02300 [Planctomycetes bacterium GWC2_45_44]|uniref:General secretion pathway protein G n=1 Tax=candidate division CPR1 bacterium GW2011_GWA2_42_17 TaxID=1618341 RepID=A0A0G1C4W3_9BACT|nr:MAG: hypothetical protein UV05_C0002G0010 [candidate division CPR1 bacterium GW2011_GWA2_42_17]OHB44051.1 MAG: hypothetical protein A2Y13_02300 [Planctomycetes bacterium GWC2_45_44]
MRKRFFMKTKKAFTLVELLVVISIIALLLAVLMPALGKARESARSVVCKANLRAMGQLEVMYHESNNGVAAWTYLETPGKSNSSRFWAISLWSMMGKVPVSTPADPLLRNVQPVKGAWLRCPTSISLKKTTWSDGPVVGGILTQRYLSELSYTRNSFDPLSVGWYGESANNTPIRVGRMRSPASIPDVAEGRHFHAPATTPIYWDLKYAKTYPAFWIIDYYHNSNTGVNVLAWDGHVESNRNSFFDKYTMLPRSLW